MIDKYKNYNHTIECKEKDCLHKNLFKVSVSRNRLKPVRACVECGSTAVEYFVRPRPLDKKIKCLSCRGAGIKEYAEFGIKAECLECKGRGFIGYKVVEEKEERVIKDDSQSDEAMEFLNSL